MQLSTKYGYVKWVPLALSVIFGAIVLGSELELEDLHDRPFAAGLAALAGIAIFASLIIWLACKTTLCCPKCNYWVGSRYDVRICRRCGYRL